MGMDLKVIIGHSLEPKEILQVPELIENDNRFHKNSQFFEGKYKKPTWYNYGREREGFMDENLMQEIWKDCETDSDEAGMRDVKIDCHWGAIEFCRKCVIVDFSALHKYGNLRQTEPGRYIMRMSRNVAQLLNHNEIIYCVDSFLPTAKIWGKAFTGLSFVEVKNWANKTFGKPPTEINEAIHNYYFIDDVNSELQKIDPEKGVFKRWGYVDGEDIDRLGIWKRDW